MAPEKFLLYLNALYTHTCGEIFIPPCQLALYCLRYRVDNWGAAFCRYSGLYFNFCYPSSWHRVLMQESKEFRAQPDHSLPSTTKVKNIWISTSTAQ